MASSFATRFNVAVDLEVMWHHLGTVDLDAELGALDLGADLIGKKRLNNQYK